MKRIFSISLAVLAAVCLFRASQFLNTAHAQEQGQSRDRAVHGINQRGADATDADDNNGANSPETNPDAHAGSGLALTAGTTTTRSPSIRWHGGPVIGT